MERSYGNMKGGLFGNLGIEGKIAAIAVLATLLAVLACGAPQQAMAADGLQATGVPATQAGLSVGDTFTKGGNLYKVIEVDADGTDPSEVMLVKYGSSKTKAKVNAVTYKGETFEVDRIGKNAFNNAKGHKVASLTIGNHVDRIQAKAFYGCKKLKTINLRKADVIELEKTAKGYRIDELDIAKTAFAKAGTAKVKAYCGKSSAAYQKAFKKALVRVGLPSTVRVVK